MPALLILAALTGGWVWWRRRARRILTRAAPESYILPQDDSWSIDQSGMRHDRTLGIAGAVNFRDIGGYPASDGKRIRWGLLYRSGTLSELSDEGIRALATLGINLVCDFRSPFEVVSAPDQAGRFGARYEAMPLDADHGSLRRLRVAMFQPARLRDLMRESYTSLMLERNAPLIGHFLNLVADPSNLPVLFHCTAGKDRTGMSAMILMSLLGVSDDVIAADYSLSNRFYHRFRVYVGSAIRRIRWLGLTVDDLRPLLIADPGLMRDALKSVRDQYGSVESYVTARCGVQAQTISALRQLLLEDS